MPLSPLIAIHMTFALSAVALGPFALWARLGSVVRPHWHRAFGYAWLTCMIGAALSAAFIRSTHQLSIGGFSLIHLLIPLTLMGLWRGFTYLAQGNVRGHQITMQCIYVLACIVTGLFTLTPSRFLGRLLWGE